MFYGRSGILGDLSALFRKRTSSLVTCRGRRRVGKSTLIEADAETLRALGYRSLMRMYRASKCGPGVYGTEMMEVRAA